MKDNEVLALFQHNRLREYPLTGGPSVYRVSTAPVKMLVDYSIALLQAMNWQGVAMVEFRYDEPRQEARLMEVNGRFWGSIPLAVKAGVNFPYILYQTMGLNQDIAPVTDYQVGVHCRQLSADIKWLAKVLTQKLAPGRIALEISKRQAVIEFLKAFSPRVKYDIEWRNDLRPAIAFWIQKIGRSIKLGPRV